MDANLDHIRFLGEIVDELSSLKHVPVAIIEPIPLERQDEIKGFVIKYANTILYVGPYTYYMQNHNNHSGLYMMEMVTNDMNLWGERFKRFVFEINDLDKREAIDKAITSREVFEMPRKERAYALLQISVNDNVDTSDNQDDDDWYSDEMTYSSRGVINHG